MDNGNQYKCAYGMDDNKCHRILCNQERAGVSHVRIMLVKHMIASLYSCQTHHELIQTMCYNLFISLAEFWYKYHRCLEQTWEDAWEEAAHKIDLEEMFQIALKSIKSISFLRNEMKPELLLIEDYEMLEEAYSTISRNTESIRQKAISRRRKRL